MRWDQRSPDTVILDTSELVTVVALVTLHTDALHATRDEPVAFVLPGTAFRVSAGGSRNDRTWPARMQ